MPSSAHIDSHKHTHPTYSNNNSNKMRTLIKKKTNALPENRNGPKIWEMLEVQMYLIAELVNEYL